MKSVVALEFACRELGGDNPGTPVVFLVHLAAKALAFLAR